MRRRFRWIYIITYLSGTEYRGDCPRWAAEPILGEHTITRVRTLWIGPEWHCPQCETGTHSV